MKKSVTVWFLALVIVSWLSGGGRVAAGPFDDEPIRVDEEPATAVAAAAVGPADGEPGAEQTEQTEPTEDAAAAALAAPAAPAAPEEPLTASPSGPAKPARPPSTSTWTDVPTDTSRGFRPNNKTTVYYLKDGKKVSRSVGSSTTDDLIALLQDLHRQGIKITELEIKGHGAPELQTMGAGTFLVASNKRILASLRSGRDVDITPLLLAVLAPDAKIDLNGCKTARGTGSVAEEFSRALPGRYVTGGSLYQMGIPFTAKSLGTKIWFKDGERVAKKWYRID
ncbi:MAG: hypothetical protein OZSIB_3724 [Candidatus Ozemobacter sibiricus]|jgi:hypothetical protein|uniref:Uncharacterized protein n=1 Tax=Candidatus Ozemobacter sibiricus TaxID=2268124 RepID=A0A367ZEP5_9BACT|nr:MAG: hypothetical protein OZSIB_3724 [Candidatus Ozemobacter sibiricus]